MNSWDYMKGGDYAKAVEAYSESLQENMSRGDLFNRALAYLNMGDHIHALSDLDEAERNYREDTYLAKHNHLTDSYRNFMGVIHWLAGNTSLALTVWRDLLSDHEARLITYTDAAGGIETPCLAWFGGTMQADSELVHRAELLLKKRLRSKQAMAFPGAIGQYLLGTITDDDLILAASVSIPLASRHLCRAKFWMGVKACTAGNQANAITMFRESVESRALLEEEFYLAGNELKRLTKA